MTNQRTPFASPFRAAVAITWLSALCAISTPALAVDSTPSLCVWDPIGASGQLFDAAKSYALAAQKMGVELKLKAYTDERVAAEDFRVGQCAALLATSMRTKVYTPVSAAIDYGGAATVVRDGKIDIAASYDVVRKVVQTFSSPQAANLMVEGANEIGGIFPFGSAYPVVADRKTDSVEALAGKKIAAFDYDQAQARDLGAASEASSISLQALMAIHMTHRLGAVLVTVAMLWLAWRASRVPGQGAVLDARVLLALWLFQAASGLSNVVLGWPLAAALAPASTAAFTLPTSPWASTVMRPPPMEMVLTNLTLAALTMASLASTLPT